MGVHLKTMTYSEVKGPLLHLRSSSEKVMSMEMEEIALNLDIKYIFRFHVLFVEFSFLLFFLFLIYGTKYMIKKLKQIIFKSSHKIINQFTNSGFEAAVGLYMKNKPRKEKQREINYIGGLLKCNYSRNRVKLIGEDI